MAISSTWLKVTWTIAAFGLVVASASCGSDSKSSAPPSSASSSAASDSTASSAPPSSASTSAASGSTTGETTPSSGDLSGVFKVAAVLPMSGALGSVGKDAAAGLDAEAEIINANGGILGRKVEITYRDTASDPQRAIAATQEVLATDDLNLYVAPNISDESIAVSPLTTDAKMLSIGSCGSAKCTDPAAWPYHFSVNIPGTKELDAVVPYIAKSHKKVAILAGNDPAGEAYANGMSDRAAAAGFEVTATELIDTSSKDVTAQLQNLRDSDPDLLYVAVTGTAPVTVVAQGIADLGWDVPVLGSAGVATADLNAAVPDEIKDRFTATTWRVGSRTGDTVDSSFASLVDGVNSNGGATSLVVAAVSADILVLAKYAYEKAGTLDPVAAAKQLEQIGTDPTATTLSTWVLRGTNPNFSADAHSGINAQTGEGFYAIVKISPLISGTYVGAPIED